MLINFVSLNCSFADSQSSRYVFSMQTRSWYRSWFDSPYYPILYKSRDESEAAFFIDRLIKYLNPSSDSKFLDMACGRGRHSIRIHQKGFDVTGIDLSKNSIEEAKKNEDPGLRFYVHDMRERFKAAQYDYVLNLFTSFGYFNTREQNEDVLRTANTSLKEDGTLVIDFLNPSKIKKQIKESETREISGVKFRIRRAYKDGWIIKKIKVEDGGKSYNFEERVWAIDHEVFKSMLSRSDFEILDTFGNYNMNAYNPDESERQIIIARKSS